MMKPFTLVLLFFIGWTTVQACPKKEMECVPGVFNMTTKEGCTRQCICPANRQASAISCGSTVCPNTERLPPCGVRCTPMKIYLHEDGYNVCTCPPCGNSCKAECSHMVKPAYGMGSAEAPAPPPFQPSEPTEPARRPPRGPCTPQDPNNYCNPGSEFMQSDGCTYCTCPASYRKADATDCNSDMCNPPTAAPTPPPVTQPPCHRLPKPSYIRPSYITPQYVEPPNLEPPVMPPEVSPPYPRPPYTKPPCPGIKPPFALPPPLTRPPMAYPTRVRPTFFPGPPAPPFSRPTSPPSSCGPPANPPTRPTPPTERPTRPPRPTVGPTPYYPPSYPRPCESRPYTFGSNPVPRMKFPSEMHNPLARSDFTSRLFNPSPRSITSTSSPSTSYQSARVEYLSRDWPNPKEEEFQWQAPVKPQWQFAAKPQVDVPQQEQDFETKQPNPNQEDKLSVQKEGSGSSDPWDSDVFSPLEDPKPLRKAYEKSKPFGQKFQYPFKAQYDSPVKSSLGNPLYKQQSVDMSPKLLCKPGQRFGECDQCYCTDDGKDIECDNIVCPPEPRSY